MTVTLDGWIGVTQGEGDPMTDRNPLYARAGRHGTKSERRVAKTMAARLTPASGAFPGHKGDFRKGRFLWEAKATVKTSATVKLEWLTKITREATEKGCDPALSLSFVNGSGAAQPGGDWVCIPRYVFDELMEK